MAVVELKNEQGIRETVELRSPPDLTLQPGIRPVRLAYAAAHVVVNAEYTAVDRRRRDLIEQIDWDSTLAFRSHLWSLGFGVAEAMDTAQRSSLGWTVASELIRRTLKEAQQATGPGRLVVAGAGTDGLETPNPSVSMLVDEYVRQATYIRERGGAVILLASPHVCQILSSEADYVSLYSDICRHLEPPVFVHWLGEMFDRRLAGYFPESSFFRIMEQNEDVLRGVKLSLLDEAFERRVRATLAPYGQIVLTGDDYNYSSLILGTGTNQSVGTVDISGQTVPVGDFSHALLGIFDAIAPVAAKALERLAEGDRRGYRALMDPTEKLARHLFAPPTEHYKAGVVFLAWLNGHQPHFRMVDDLQRSRSRDHYVIAFRLANECGVLTNPSLAAQRMHEFLELYR